MIGTLFEPLTILICTAPSTDTPPSMAMSSPAIETSLSFSPAVALDHHGLGG